MEKPLRVALLGFGTVGSAVAKVMVERTNLADRLTLTHILNRDVERKRNEAPWVPSSVTWTENIDEVFATKPDVIAEVIGGIDPAGFWVQRALQQGVHVVTANKMLLATHGQVLSHLARTHGSQIRFEASVCGGVPVVQGIRQGLAGDNLTHVAGILNGTSNYILSRMANGNEPMSVVLNDAIELGYAEVDPSADIDGQDAAAKLVLLAGIVFHRHLHLSDIPCTSIRPISPADFQYARHLGCSIRQIALAESRENGFNAFVGPMLVRTASSFGRNEGVNNFVTTSGQYGGEISFSGAGAGGPATAVAVVSDLLALTHHSEGDREEERISARITASPARPYYIRFVVRDRPGILATITDALAQQSINVDAVLQEPGFPKDALPFVITVEACEQSALQAALKEINKADFHVEAPLALPMLTGT